MSLEEKFKEYAREAGKNGQRLFGFEDLQRAFYAGAEAVLPVAAYNADLAVEYQAEIDHFRSHK